MVIRTNEILCHSFTVGIVFSVLYTKYSYNCDGSCHGITNIKKQSNYIFKLHLYYFRAVLFLCKDFCLWIDFFDWGENVKFLHNSFLPYFKHRHSIWTLPAAVISLCFMNYHYFFWSLFLGSNSMEFNAGTKIFFMSLRLVLKLSKH